MQQFDDVGEDDPILRIGPAAELAGMHPQTLRQYDRIGLVVPGRTQGGSRRYSLRNIRQLRQVQELSNEGISLPAIARILDLEDEVTDLRHRVVQLQSELRAERENRPGARVFAAETSGAVVTLTSGTRVRRRTDVVLWRPQGR
ncbi:MULTISPECIES: heat shock protein transcriptional repressor HspR [unclassified Microbacterium]|uniref:heat shock protein transcriptional repressor HspR n=1 Tax=unclassified Microbacterium TaxID=2609290 RepID=UPI00097EE7D7|nr:MerR family transcriptional regulator [Microbacterium sp. JB110]RCS60055.1 MerR family transcriptional regulator [Microbacterium sp. JB110]SJM45220.1 HspR, transcriptional repressor of DnaK operon [Frigoribacterium sp. JB110]